MGKIEISEKADKQASEVAVYTRVKDKDGKEVEKLVGVYKSIGICANKLDLDKGNISRCIKGTLKSTKGYYFKLITHGRNEQIENDSMQSLMKASVYRGIERMTAN